MQSDTREYIALRKLAVILFQSGDIDPSLPLPHAVYGRCEGV